MSDLNKKNINYGALNRFYQDLKSHDISTLNDKIDNIDVPEYVAGNNIQINGNVISATDTKYTAGANVSINNNVISSNLPTASSSTKGGVKVGDGLSISNEVLSVDTSNLDNLYFNVAKLSEESISEYLTFEAINTCTISFGSFLMTPTLTIEVSTDGINWVSKTATNSSTSTELATLNAGEKLYVRGDNPTYAKVTFTSIGYGTNFHFFTASDSCYVYGNVMSLINSTNFKNIAEFNGSFYKLFSNVWDSSKAVNFYSKSDKLLILSSITLDSPYHTNNGDVGTYEKMFYNCLNISKVGVLTKYNNNMSHNRAFRNWLNGCAAEGVVYINDYTIAIDDSVYDNNSNHIKFYLPSGWTMKKLLGKDFISANNATV